MNAKSIRLAALFAALCLIGTFPLHGQQGRNPQSVTFKEGKVFMLDTDKPVEATNDVTLPGQIKVMTNGVFTVKAARERQLREGQVLGADGTLSSPDGSVVPVEDHFVVLGGRVQVVKDGDNIPLSGEKMLPDGSRLQADGTITGRDGRIRRLLDGQRLKLDGTVLPVTDTVSLQAGKVILFKDGGRIQLNRGQVMAMSDGSRVSGDGTIVRSDGSRVTLKEGEILKLPGPVSRGK